jgi:hypothetical protein
LALRPHQLGPDDGQRYAGIKQEEPMIDWLHDCYFAAVAGDSPTFEAWPTNQGELHPTPCIQQAKLLIDRVRLSSSRIYTRSVGHASRRDG